MPLPPGGTPKPPSGPGGGGGPIKTTPSSNSAATSYSYESNIVAESDLNKKKRELQEKEISCSALFGQEKLRCEMSAKLGVETGQQKGPNLL